MSRKKPVVAVLMSTFNGEKYLREQVDSIFCQEGVIVRLYVRDDGSSDSTVRILQEYAQHHPVTFLSDSENVGPGESFMRLVYRYAYEEDVDYYAFADQDDVWLPEKLIAAVRMIRKSSRPGPFLYSSNQFLYEEGQNQGKRHDERQSTSLIPHLTRNTISGCTFVFNSQLARLVADAPRPEQRILKYRLHDAWLMLVAIACGYAVYDETPYMLYRIHSDNAVGVKEIPVRKKLAKLQRFFVKRDDANLRMITARELLRLFPQISGRIRRILSLYANYQRSWEDKKRLAFNRTIRRECGEDPNIFTLKVLMDFV